MTIPIRRLANPLFGQPTLATGGSGTATWAKNSSLGQFQKGTGWQAELYGGAQSGDDWAACYISVDEIHVPDFNSAQWSWYQTNAETMGLGMVIWIHDPSDFDKRAEVTQLANVEGLDKGAGWNSHEWDKTVTQMFFYGENTTGTGLTAGTQYPWTSFQSDVLFKHWTIYRISFDWGWEASGTFETAYLAEVKLNGVNVLIMPGSAEQFDLIRGRGLVYIKADTAAADTARRLETATTRLRDAYILVTTKNQLFGDSSGQTYLVAANGSINFRYIDISTLYFKNASAGENGTVTCLGTRE